MLVKVILYMQTITVNNRIKMRKNLLGILILLFVAVNLNAANKVFNSIVAADGSGDYTSVQAAIDAVPENNLN